MKKILLVLVAVLFLATSAYAINVKETTEAFNPAASTTDKEQVIATVYNATDETLSTGMVVAWDLTADEGRSVTKVNRLGQPVAGVINSTIAEGAWGTMVVYGYHSAVIVPGTVATGGSATAGYPLYAYGTTDDDSTTNTVITNDGKAGNGQTAAHGAATTKNIKSFGVALDTTTSATTVEAFINCLG